MEESTAENAKTLKRDLKKMLAEILSHGGGEIKDHGETDGVLREIDEAIRILDRLREVELKRMPSPSPKAEVPKVFKCILSNEIMIEPVIIASGQTYEKRRITDWLDHKGATCPESDEDLPHSLWTPNHLVDELITKWCRANEQDRIKPSDEIVTELSEDGIDSLLYRISSPSSVEDQTEAAKELRHQTKRFPNVRDLFHELPVDPIKRLLSPFSGLGCDTHKELQENLIGALFNISTVAKSQTKVCNNDAVIPLLTKSLRDGTPETQRNSVLTLFALLADGSNKGSIGNSKTLMALTGVIRRGDLVTSVEAAFVVNNLCSELFIRENAISVGMVGELIDKVKEGAAGPKAADFLSVLVLFSRDERAIREMEQSAGFFKYLFSILRKRSCSMTCEHAAMIFLNVCSLATPHENKVRTRLSVIDEEENEHGTFSMLTRQRSKLVVRIAERILQWLKKYGTGKDPQMD